MIRGILDRSRKLASPFGGPWLLRKFYQEVPLASLSFAILRVKPEMSSLGGLGSWSFLFPKPAVAVISARYLRALHLRAEAFTDSDDDAHAITEKTSAFLKPLSRRRRQRRRAGYGSRCKGILRQPQSRTGRRSSRFSQPPCRPDSSAKS